MTHNVSNGTIKHSVLYIYHTIGSYDLDYSRDQLLLSLDPRVGFQNATSLRRSGRFVRCDRSRPVVKSDPFIVVLLRLSPLSSTCRVSLTHADVDASTCWCARRRTAAEATPAARLTPAVARSASARHECL